MVNANCAVELAASNTVSPVPPTITQLTPPQQNITSPNMANISCEATGKPRPIITWYRVQLNGTDRVRLSNDDSNIMIQATEEGNRTLMSGLTISPTAPSDATDYVCVAENVVDTDEITSSLTIHGKFASFLHALFRFLPTYAYAMLLVG